MILTGFNMNCTQDEACPYCGEEIEDLWEHFSDQSDPKFTCPHCNKRMEGKEIITYELCRAEE